MSSSETNNDSFWSSRALHTRAFWSVAKKTTTTNETKQKKKTNKQTKQLFYLFSL